MLLATLFLLGLGLGAAVLLAIASKVFYVYEDPKLIEIEDALLGANCGACGYPGCSSAAEAVLAGKEGANICVAGGASIAVKVAEVMGLEIQIREPQIACTTCTYGTDRAATRFTYIGINDCAAAILYGNGPKVCTVGCMGLGTCVRACPFGALSMGPEGLPVVDKKRCRACGICVEICPKNIMELTSTSDRMLGDYRTDQCTTPCQRECPTGIDIPRYIKKISEGDFREAIRVIKERNPLPMVCGRICPAPCELNCRRNLVDEAVAINPLKRFVSEHERTRSEHVLPFKNPDTGKKVAIIGGGAQGLSTAFYMACMGHEPMIYEAAPKLGGILHKVIPQSRLSDAEFDWEIEGILSAGVHAQTGTVLGTDITVPGLIAEGYDLVALATGGIDSRSIVRPDATEQAIPGVFMLVDFLHAAGKGTLPQLGDSVCIIGAGRSTLAAADACIDSRVSSVTVVYPYSRADLIARGIDFATAEARGVTFKFETVVNALRGAGEALTGLTLTTMDGTREDTNANAVVVATGRLSDLVFRAIPPSEEDSKAVAWETVPAFRTQPGEPSEDLFGTLAEGVLNDNMAVVRSIGRGRRVARAMHQVLTGKDIEQQPDILLRGTAVQDVQELENVDPNVRTRSPGTGKLVHFCAPEVLFDATEIEAVFSEDMARQEAARCLECGLICYQHGESD